MPSMAFALRRQARLLLGPPEGGPRLTTLQASLLVADWPVAPAPLRTPPLDHARGLHYRGPWRLPGPDSHRLAALSLSLSYVTTTSLSSWRPNCWTHYPQTTGRMPSSRVIERRLSPLLWCVGVDAETELADQLWARSMLPGWKRPMRTSSEDLLRAEHDRVRRGIRSTFRLTSGCVRHRVDVQADRVDAVVVAHVDPQTPILARCRR